MKWAIEQLQASHDIASFDCGEISLNSFLKKHAFNNDHAGLGRTFVATEPGHSLVAGYFTVATGSVRFDAIPDYPAKRLPKYPIPTIHIGRLAVDRRFQGKSLGEVLLVESIRKAAAASTGIGVYAIDVLALHERAKAFYLKYGFIEMLDTPLHLFLSMHTARIVAAAIGP